MQNEEQDDNTIYTVVVNHEEQYSIWPVNREIPLGWRSAEKSGSKADCLAYVNEVWIDMRPLSLRKKMNATEQTIGRPKKTSAKTPSAKKGSTLKKRR